MAEEQRRLIRVRRRLTELFVLLAASRKKLHVIRPPREVRDAGGPDFDAGTWDAAAYSHAIIGRCAPDYARAQIETSEARP
jgi:hypothetical protein